MRAFLGLWPDADTALAIAQWREQCWRALARPTAVQQLHLTVAFLGDLDSDREAALCAALSRPLPGVDELHFNQISWQARARMLWLEPDNPVPLEALVRSARRAAQRAGIGVGGDRQQPHITLARRVDPLPPPLLAPDFRWRPAALTLVHSRLGAAGPQYTPVAEWSLEQARGEQRDGAPISSGD